MRPPPGWRWDRPSVLVPKRFDDAHLRQDFEVNREAMVELGWTATPV